MRLSLAKGAMLLGTVALLPLPTMAQPAMTPAPTSYRTMVGDDAVTVLSDGAVVRPLKEVLPGAGGPAATTTIPINVYLVKAGSKLILVDSGAGALLGPGGAGHLLASLRDAGYEPAQIDAILLTHAHPDHLGGLSDAGAIRFPNATLYVDARELLAPADDPSDTPRTKALRRFQQLMIEPYRRAGRLKTFDGAGELLPGVHAVPAYGHSPGHTAFMIESRGRRLLLWGDVIHVAGSQFQDPALAAGSDWNASQAVEARMRLLALAAKQNLLVGGAHIAFPGLGHVRRQGTGYAWVPLPPR